jgi:hypothetical protein
LLVAGPALEGPPSEPDYNTWIVHGPEEARTTVAEFKNHPHFQSSVNLTFQQKQ